jgi:hypothetical protein
MGRLRVKRYGTRAEVMNGTARMTRGLLVKEDFTYNKHGYIVSKKKSKMMKGDDNPLRQMGLLQNKKGVFGPKTKKTISSKKKGNNSNNKKSNRRKSNNRKSKKKSSSKKK